jgi:hypothetical protein
MPSSDAVGLARRAKRCCRLRAFGMLRYGCARAPNHGCVVLLKLSNGSVDTPAVRATQQSLVPLTGGDLQ